MKRLADLMTALEPLQRRGNTDVVIRSVTDNSRSVEQGSLFAAIRGTTVDGHSFIEQAVAAGAVAVLCEVMPERLHPNVTYLQVPHSAEALARLAEAYYDFPSYHLTVVAVTGTNGKTTVATQLYRLFSLLGYRCGLISTIENRINDRVLEATHTTPAAITLSRLLSEMREAACTYCFMEASSHALDQNRIAGLRLAGGVFTNISHDHLDYHKTFDAYLKAKKKLFDGLPAEAFALVNADDARASVMVQNTRATRYTYSLKGMADFRMNVLEQSLDGTLVRVEGREVYLRLIGSFNASNLLAVYAVARLLGVPAEPALQRLSELSPIAGRLQVIRGVSGGITGIVDYAHTPDALEQVLQTLRQLVRRSGHLLVVVGCGGNRDREKRPLMAAVAARLADRVILTSDNPRWEDPQQILDEMMTGISVNDRQRVLTIVQRREAIRTAVALSQAGDVVLVAGKGHEPYQEIAGVRHPFDDWDELKKALEEKSMQC
ncbi:MAG: UDP-N-acetylmuramoyl-L-alanyl-D-glutamate--2,6-diaminopimelate ligase [Chitinophagales bacterium]|nr:UDP-N-acetylmuramoyl-L-alanyl-D-glutamate--2,6-diaminopimelate ligase [Chitinophagales bacterium]MDW8392947.1 UDP-N-acetylmuramoyl-L-alanyl-D-glutamate--2,6-diaminopimelate ligase [Chitinophagales bacterium]